MGAALGACVPGAVDAPAASMRYDAAVDTTSATDDGVAADVGTARDTQSSRDIGITTDVANPTTDVANPTTDAAIPTTDVGNPTTDVSNPTTDVANPTTDTGRVVDVVTTDVVRADVSPLDAPLPPDAGSPMDVASAPDVIPLDAPTDGGLPPIDAWSGALPTPTRTPADWGPLRVTTRTDSGDGLAPVERLVYGYAARRVNYVDTERWSGSAWTPYERWTYAYTTAGAIDARFVYRFTSRWTEFQRWRFEYNPDGTLRVEHGDIRTGTTWGETMQITWEWSDGLAAWQRYYLAAAVGAASVKMWENTFEYDATRRFTSYWRIERRRPTDSFTLAGRWTPTVRPTGHVDRETFSLGGVDAVRVSRYDAAGKLLEVADDQQVDRYLYDARGRLRFVRTYVASDGTWSLAREVEIEGTDEGGDLTWALDPFPYETWRRDRYGRGDLVDRYRR